MDNSDTEKNKKIVSKIEIQIIAFGYFYIMESLSILFYLLYNYIFDGHDIRKYERRRV
jgi:hypothetical protein